MKSIFLLLIGAIFLIAACSSGYIVNMKEHTDFPGGRQLFISKCNSCHQLFSPNRFSKTKWDSILIPMKKKAKISSEQKNEIYNWILEIKDNYEKSLVKNQNL